MTSDNSEIESQNFIVSDRMAHQRLDQFLIRRGIPQSRTYLQKLIRQGAVRVNRQPAKPSYSVQSGDRIQILLPAPTRIEILPEAIPLNIVYEDSDLLVVNKPAGLVVHPAPGHYTGTLVNALLHYCRDLSGIGGRERPGIVHRLDKGTSGLLLVAKTDSAHRKLSSQFASHTIHRRYQALVRGRIRKGLNEVNLAIGRDRRERKKISHRTQRPREAVTLIRVLERFKEATWVEATPKTGRTHQIRVHLASLGHPVLGDPTYGGRKAVSLGDIRFDRPMLHARHLGFIHPSREEPMDFEAPLPLDMETTLDLLRASKITGKRYES